jgi:hypothetical protein
MADIAGEPANGFVRGRAPTSKVALAAAQSAATPPLKTARFIFAP